MHIARSICYNTILEKNVIPWAFMSLYICVLNFCQLESIFRCITYEPHYCAKLMDHKTCMLSLILLQPDDFLGFSTLRKSVGNGVRNDCIKIFRKDRTLNFWIKIFSKWPLRYIDLYGINYTMVWIKDTWRRTPYPYFKIIQTSESPFRK